ncbi:MAG: hypothetical protein ACR2NB_02585 [Solirubrobacteraceae bacterium]
MGRDQYEALSAPVGALAVGNPQEVAEKILYEQSRAETPVVRAYL